MMAAVLMAGLLAGFTIAILFANPDPPPPDRPASRCGTK
jgi:hypothetical protein